MKYYLKIQNNIIVEAPYILKGDTFTIYGYNTQGNEARLKSDGYTAFEKPIYNYKIKNGVIVEKEIIPQQKNVFTKLEIRRAFRELNLEDKLIELLESNKNYKNDWNDANEINILDPMFINAIQQGYLTEEEINRIKHILEFEK